VTGILQLGSTAALVLPVPPTTYYFSKITMTGASSLTLNNTGGQHVDIYISDQLSMAGNGVINTTAKSTDLQIASCGSPATPSTWTVTGGSGAYFSLYAPNHPVTVSGTGDIYGSIIGASLSFPGNAKIHYDAALARRAANTLVILGGSWAQVPQ
jgi:hypothetical protein